jgi:uncharacterized coiled-coil DUF342 family protein
MSTEPGSAKRRNEIIEQMAKLKQELQDTDSQSEIDQLYTWYMKLQEELDTFYDDEQMFI